MRYKKGLVYVIEGIFASLMLGSYLFQIISIDTNIQIVEEKIIERQALYSYLASINNLTAREIITNNNMLSSFYSLSLYILGKENRYDLGFSGESKYKLVIGVYIPSDRSIKTDYIKTYDNPEDCKKMLWGNLEDFERVIHIKKCKTGKISNEYNMLLVVPKNSHKSNVIFIDFNKDGRYSVGEIGEKREGPYVYDDIIERKDETYYVGDTPITNNTYFMYKINKEELTIKKEMEKERYINSQKIKFFVRFFTLSQPISQYDVLLFPHQIPSQIINDVITFYYSGRDVILLSPTDFQSYYSTLFNVHPIQGTNYEYSIKSSEVEEKPYPNVNKEDYIMNLATHTNLYTFRLSYPVPPEYKTDHIGDKKYMRYYILNTTKGNATLITYPSSLPDIYNLYIDYDNDKNFDESPDNQPINLTTDRYSYFTWNGDTYKLIYHSSNGRIGKIKVYKEKAYLNEPLTSLYFPNVSSSAWRLNFKDSEVCLNCTRKLNEKIITALTKISNNRWKGKLIIKKEVWEYTFYVINASSSYYLYLISDYNKKYYNNSNIILYPEEYNITLYPSKNYVSWTLSSRIPLPYVSDKINKKGGDAVFIPHLHIIYYRDELNFLFNILYTISSNNLYWIKRAKKIGEESGDVLVTWNPNREHTQLIKIIMNKHLR